MWRAGILLLVISASSGCALHRPVGEHPDAPPAGGTLEAQDPVLTAAWLELRAMETAAAHRRVAERYVELGILDAAFDHFTRAAGLDTRDAAASDGLARIWRDWGFPHLGLGNAMRAVYYAPASAAAHNTVGTLLVAIGRWDEARRAYTRALELESPDGRAYILSNLCYLSFLEGEPSRAAGECRAALDTDPGLTAARNNLALAHAAAGGGDLAAREFLAAGDAAAAHYNMGIVHLAAGRYRNATEAFEAASRQRPAWIAALQRARNARALAASAARRVRPNR